MDDPMTQSSSTSSNPTAKTLIQISQALSDGLALDPHTTKDTSDRDAWTTERLIHMSQSLGQGFGG
jgi:hypothetical protein